MRELKVYHCNEWHNEYTEFYMKSDVDKVIADLEESHKMEVEQLLMEIAGLKDKLRHCPMMSALLESDKKEIAGLKDKRSAELGMPVSTWESKIEYYKRWQKKRWLKLAEKFKEAK